MEKFDNGAWEALMRQTTPCSLGQLFTTSNIFHHAVERRVEQIKHLSTDGYLAEVFCCEVDHIHKIMNALTQFVNYHVQKTNFQPAQLAEEIRERIANHLRPDWTRKQLFNFTPNEKCVGQQELLRMDATFGEPNLCQHQLKLTQLPIALILVSITLGTIAPLAPRFDCAKLIRNWILFDIHHNAEAQRLGNLCQNYIDRWQTPNTRLDQPRPSPPVPKL